jgi:hypothetical protein
MQSLKEKKYFADLQSGALNADDAAFVIPTNEWVNAENVRTGSTDAGNTGVMESIGSNVLLSSPEPSVTFIVIGSAEDEANKRLIYFKYSIYSPNHKIVAYDTVNNVEYDVLLSSQVDGGLDFDKNYPIHSARVVNGLLYWTDNLNEPKKINIDSGIKTNYPSYVTDASPYATPLTYEMTTVIKRPPMFPATFSKFYDDTVAINNIQSNAFQFAYRYYFKDGEYSVLSPYSLTANYNTKVDTTNYATDLNYINILMSFSERIQDDVFQVELIVRYLPDSSDFVVKTWNKDLSTDLSEINNHNDGITPLTYNFYNDTAGQAIDNATATKHNESVPILTETLEVAKNRLFMGNNLMGYTSPLETSLALTNILSPDAGDVIGSWSIVRYDDGMHIRNAYFIYLSSPVDSPGYYSYIDNVPPYPSIIAFADLTLEGTELNSSIVDGGTIIEIFADVADSTVTGAPITVAPATSMFKSNSYYKSGVVFYDRHRRWCGYVSNDDLRVKIPARDYANLNMIVNVRWDLSNTNALQEIPDWAYYYAPVLSKSLNTSFFVQGATPSQGLKYAVKDPVSGVISYSGSQASTNYGVAINISLLTGFGLGYSYQEGDLVFLYIESDSVVYTSRVIAQDGSYIIVQLLDLGDLTTSPNCVFEIFTPIPSVANKVLYEVGQIYTITEPTTNARAYSSLTGLFQPDVYAITRGTDQYEAMSPNDKYWRIWNTNSGFPSFFDNIGQKRLKNQVAYSNVIIDNTRVNGLSAFDPLDVSDMPNECGELMKLQTTSKVNNELGVVMLGICANETASLYIGEVQLVGQNANAFLAQAPNVIGTINILKGSYGTLNPESVTEYRGNVFWFDTSNGRYIHYSVNGLFPISNLKMTKFWKLFAEQYISMTKGDIEALGSRPFIFSTVDPYHDELLITIPKLLATPANGYTPDYPSMIYPFDIWDGQAKTIVYKLDKTGANPHWQGSYSFEAENFITSQNKLYSFKYGHLYLHNQIDSFNNFYGEQFSSKVMCVANMQGNMPKVFNNIMVEGNLKPDFVYFYNNYPYTQTSDLLDIDFRDYEGVFNATILRNKIIPTSSGFTTDGLLTAEKLRNVAMYCMLQWNEANTQLQLKFVTFGFALSHGYGQ